MPGTPADWAELLDTYLELEALADGLGLVTIKDLAGAGAENAEDRDGEACDEINDSLEAAKPNPCPSEIEILIAKLKAIRARMQ